MAAVAPGASTDPAVARALDVLYTSYDKLIASAEHPEQVRVALRAPTSRWTVLTVWLLRPVVPAACPLQSKSSYEAILAQVSGPPQAKQLAAQFIPKFVRFYPDLADAALNAQIDLCEDDSLQVRGWPPGVARVPRRLPRQRHACHRG